MKFTVSNSALLTHLQALSRVIASKNTILILDSFLFELEGHKLRITASDSETTMETFVEINGNEGGGNGKFAISSKSILDVLREIPEQPITITVNDENYETSIAYQNGVLNLMGQNPMEYPATPQIADEEGTLAIVMPSEVMLNGISKCLFATDNNDYHPAMNGIFFDFDADMLTIVSSNGHILVRNRNKEVACGSKSSFILPKKPAMLLRNILPREESDVKMKFNSRNAVFAMSEYVLTCRLTEGRFPNYNAVIPPSTPSKLTIDRLMLLGALKRVSVCSLPSGGLIKMSLEGAESMKVSGQDLEMSSSAEEMIPCQYEGEKMDIGFNSSYLIDMLNNISADNIQIGLVDQSRAGVITPVEQDEKNDLLMLLTPMML